MPQVTTRHRCSYRYWAERVAGPIAPTLSEPTTIEGWVIDVDSPGEHGHRVAYSIGINFPPDWGEGQIMSLQAGEERVLRPGMTFHVIPALFVPGVGATICTETVVVTGDGVESLISFERGYARR